jgi:hypothetical protein
LRAGLAAFDVFFLRVVFFLAMPKSSTALIVAAKGFLSITGWVKRPQPASEYSGMGAPRDLIAGEQD